MKNTQTGNGSNEVRVELKYCERCGSLWVRESGGAQVYCANCIPKLAELPAPCRVRASPQLPVATRAFIDDEINFTDMDELDLQSAGGAA